MAKLAILAIMTMLLMHFCLALPTPDEERYFDKEVSMNGACGCLCEALE